jgi:hypothetical protein
MNPGRATLGTAAPLFCNPAHVHNGTSAIVGVTLGSRVARRPARLMRWPIFCNCAQLQNGSGAHVQRDEGHSGGDQQGRDGNSMTAKTPATTAAYVSPLLPRHTAVFASAKRLGRYFCQSETLPVPAFGHSWPALRTAVSPEAIGTRNDLFALRAGIEQGT